MISHLYPTRCSDNNLKMYNLKSKLPRFAISFRGPTVWNKFLTQSEKSYTSINVFKNNINEKDLNFSNEFF